MLTCVARAPERGATFRSWVHGGYPSRVVKLYFETCEGAESLWKKLEEAKALMPKLLTRPTQADLAYVKGCGEVYQADDRKKIVRRDGGFMWKLKNLVM